MRTLANATLVIIDCQSPGRALSSLKKSLTQLQFEKVLFLTDINIPKLPAGIEIKKVPSIKSKDQYSKFCIKELFKYIETDYFLLIQWDSEIIDGNLWDDDWYNYDYIAPTWPFETDGLSIGCGGFSWRSKRLHEILGTDDLILATPPEDVTICRIYRRYLEEKYWMRWPTDEVAEKFGFELKEPSEPAFGKHGFFHTAFKKTVMIRRQASLGDVVMTEPVLRYFHEKGYRVVLKTLPQFYNLFYSHEFKVYHPDEVDPKILAGANEIDLDMSYESTPEQLHLLSYYQMAGIEDGEIKNPRLFTGYDYKNPDFKMFRKYCVIHNDMRSQPGRNIYGVDWEEVVVYLADLGFTIIQIGQGEHDVIKGATEMRNMNEPMLMRLIGGADLFVGIDSGPANIAIAMGTPAILFFGNVHPSYIIPDPKNVIVIQNHNPEKPICRLPHCWSSTISTEGVECVETMGQIKRTVKMFQGAECIETDQPLPPCAIFKNEQVYAAIDQILKR